MARLFKVKCEGCGTVSDIAAPGACPGCGKPIGIGGEGMLRIYRMGSPIGMAVGFGIYLDGQPFGHIANKGTACIPVRFGTHKLHITCGATRRCNDLDFTVTPDSPMVCCKASMKTGMWSNTINIVPAQPSEMPAD